MVRAGARASVHTLYDSPPIEAYQSDDFLGHTLLARLARAAMDAGMDRVDCQKFITCGAYGENGPGFEVDEVR